MGLIFVFGLKNPGMYLSVSSVSQGQIAKIYLHFLSAQWCSGTNPAYYAGGTEFKSHHKRYSFASVA